MNRNVWSYFPQIKSRARTKKCARITHFYPTNEKRRLGFVYFYSIRVPTANTAHKHNTSSIRNEYCLVRPTSTTFELFTQSEHDTSTHTHTPFWYVRLRSVRWTSCKPIEKEEQMTLLRFAAVRCVRQTECDVVVLWRAAHNKTTIFILLHTFRGHFDSIAL